ncbi:hypothetical protein JMN32_14400 [Fulvivirga sp. 29W222]|uniref:Outer membrane beta-barrel porin/alpha-amylase n=1 Tax=Fulvivirga marina TaxID=2494733 RepID=A0A937FWL7_9BACT|nr:hypothetical protein [Fulvivirga marina]MBL6447505.1 hypothetical protein [Fulvivirga marina]
MNSRSIKGKCMSLALGAAFLCFSTVQAQSGWTRKKGEYYLKVQTNHGKSDNYFNLSGEQLKTSEFVQSVTGLYGEYGITDRFTIISYGPVIKHQYFQTTEKITALGDLPIGFKYGIFQGKIPISVSLVTDIPIAKANNYAQNKENSFEQINLPAGDGEWNFRLTAAASHSFYPIPAYASVYSTFNYRTQYEGVDFTHQAMGGTEVGIIIGSKVWLIGGLSFQKSLGSGAAVDFVRGEGTEFTALEIKSAVEVYNAISLNVGYFRYMDLIIERANLYSSGIISLGLAYEFKK